METKFLNKRPDSYWYQNVNMSKTPFQPQNALQVSDYSNRVCKPQTRNGKRIPYRKPEQSVTSCQKGKVKTVSKTKF